MVLLQGVPLGYCCKCKGSLHSYVCFLRQWTLKSTTYAISLVQLLSRVQLFATPWTAAHQASLCITNSRSLLKLMSIKLVMPSNHLILCHPLLLLPSIFPSIRVFSNGSVVHIRWPKYWSFQLQHQSCILSPCLFNLYAEYIMQNARLDEAQAGIKIAGRNINNLRYADDTTLWQKEKRD